MWVFRFDSEEKRVVILRFAVVNPAVVGLIAAPLAQPSRATLGGTPRLVDPGAAEVVVLV